MDTIVTTCPHCGKVNDRHADGQHGTPKHGDVSLCFGCTEPAIFVQTGGVTTPLTLELRKPTEAELRELETTPDIVAAQLLLRAFRGHRP